MKAITVGDIQLRVRKILDEIGTNDAEFIEIEIAESGTVYDKDNYELDEIIKSKILEGVNNVHSVADYSLIDGINNIATAPTISSNLVGYLTPNTASLLSDSNSTFLRLVSVKFNEWIRPAQKVVLEVSPEYLKQKDEFARGTFEAPVVALVNYQATQRLEFYSLKSVRATLEYFIYIPYQKTFTSITTGAEPNTVTTDNVYICENLEDAICYMIAGITLATYKDKHSEALIQLAKNYMGL